MSRIIHEVDNLKTNIGLDYLLSPPKNKIVIPRNSYSEISVSIVLQYISFYLGLQRNVNIDKEPRSKIKPSDHVPIELILN